MESWKNLFLPHILKRGFDYYEQGRVSLIEHTEYGYIANVRGSVDYIVEIEISNDKVQEMFCDCPYSDEGSSCKHMAAVLYKINENETDAPNPMKQLRQAQEEKQELADIVDRIPEDELRRFVIELAQGDDSLKNRILTQYSETISPNQILQLEYEVDAIEARYSDEDGFVDYNNAYDFTQALEEFLYEKVQALLDNGLILPAFELTCYVFCCAGNQEMDDSDGGLTTVASICYSFWQQILEKSCEQEREQMKQWFQGKHEDFVCDCMDGYIEDFLVNEFHDTEILRQKLKELDEQIEMADSGAECEEQFSTCWEHENNVMLRLRLMKELDYSEQEILEYRNKYRRVSAIRQLEIKEYLENKQIEKAIEVLKESKEFDKEYAGLVSTYSRKLIELYKQTGQNDEYKSELEFQVLYCCQDDLEFVKLLKELCDEREWISYRENILESNISSYLKYQLLEYERLYDRLLESIIARGNISELDRYEKVLKKEYPERVRDTYISYIERGIEYPQGRSHYCELIKYLKKLNAYPNGREISMQIAREWKEKYKRRKALMDELKMAGF